MKHMLALFVFSVAGLSATEALAYIGPGAGISAIGSLLALVAAIALAIVGFVWYPVKRLRRRMRQKAAQPAPTVETRGPAK